MASDVDELTGYVDHGSERMAHRAHRHRADAQPHGRLQCGELALERSDLGALVHEFVFKLVDSAARVPDAPGHRQRLPQTLAKRPRDRALDHEAAGRIETVTQFSRSAGSLPGSTETRPDGGHAVDPLDDETGRTVEVRARIQRFGRDHLAPAVCQWTAHGVDRKIFGRPRRDHHGATADGEPGRERRERLMRRARTRVRSDRGNHQRARSDGDGTLRPGRRALI